MPIYKIPVHRGKYTSYSSGGKRVKLPNYFTVDNKADYKKLSKYKWYGNAEGYAYTTNAKGLGANYTRSGKLAPVYAHAYISRREEGVKTYFSPNGVRVRLSSDHQNQLRWDNRRANLRLATKQQQLANRSVAKNTKVKKVKVYGESKYQRRDTKDFNTQIKSQKQALRFFGIAKQGGRVKYKTEAEKRAAEKAVSKRYEDKNREKIREYNRIKARERRARERAQKASGKMPRIKINRK